MSAETGGKETSFKQVTEAAHGSFEELEMEFVAEEEGYLMAYTTNETNEDLDVFMDDFTIMHTTGPIVRVDDYYPFGMVYGTSELDNKLTNRFLYNGKEKEELTDWYDYGARMYDASIGRWLMIDPLAEKYLRRTPYNYTMNNPIRFIDPDGTSTHVDSLGNVVAIYDDEDLGIYQHKMNIGTWDGKKLKRKEGTKKGETLHAFSFADFDVYEASEGKVIVPGKGALIDFESEWATEQVEGILSENPTIFKYYENAGENGDWDIKRNSPTGSWYYGSLLNGKYASARDAGNFAAGAVAQNSIIPNYYFDYGFGAYAQVKNNKLKMVGVILMDVIFGAAMGTQEHMIDRSVNGENPLSKKGIDAGKQYKK